MELPDSIEPDQLKNAAVAIMVVLALVAFLIMRFVRKMVMRVILVGVVVAAGFALYAQRDDLDECQQRVRATPGLGDISDPDARCTCDFAGFEVKVPGCAAFVPGGDG